MPLSFIAGMFQLRPEPQWSTATASPTGGVFIVTLFSNLVTLHLVLHIILQSGYHTSCRVWELGSLTELVAGMVVHSYYPVATKRLSHQM